MVALLIYAKTYSACPLEAVLKFALNNKLSRF